MSSLLTPDMLKLYLFFWLMVTLCSAADTPSAISLVIGDTTFTVDLADTPAARELAAALPISIRMDDLNANEKYGDLPHPLPTRAEDVRSIHTGDLMLFTPTCLVLFYKDFRTSYRYTRGGKVREAASLPAVLGRASVQIRLLPLQH